MPAEEETPLLVDEDADDGSEGFLNRRKGLSLVEKLALATAFAFFLLAALAFGLFAGAEAQLSRRKTGPAGKESATVTVTQTLSTAPTQAPKKPEEVCLTAACVTMAADILEGLDETMDPCEDFYTFANGGWLSKHPVPEDKGLFGIAQWIDERNQRILHQILDNKPDPELNQDDQTNLQHLRALYDSCLDEDSLDRTGQKPLIDLVKPILDLWYDSHDKSLAAAPPFFPPIVPLPPNRGDKPKLDRQTRLTNVLLYLHSRAVPVFFSASLEGDVGDDPDLMRLWLSQSTLGLPNPAYYDDDETVDVYREVIRASLQSLCEDLPSRGACAPASYGKLAKDVVELERQLVGIMVDAGDAEEPSLTYNRRNITQLQQLMPQLEWRDYFSGYSPRPSLPDPLIIATPSYFERLGGILDDATESVLGAYLLWRASKAYGRLLGPSSVVRKEVTWLSNFITGVDEGVRESRADACLNQVIESAGWLIGRYYVERAFSERGKLYAEEIIAAVIQAFKDRLPELQWLDDETRAYAEEKALEIKQKIGYPLTPNTTDPTALKRYYSLQEPFDRDDLFGNVLRARLAEGRRLWNRIGARRDRGVWDMTPNEVNAAYEGSANEISFPAGELQSPYFNPEWPEYLAFGAFGAVGAGHELTHAFDPSGAQYDKTGRLYNWWTESTAASFKERQKCLLDQYAEYFVLDRRGRKVYVNSHFTLGEDLADAGGLTQAYRAWSSRFDEGGHPNFLLPGLNYTREQLFFVAQARGWARNIKPQEAVRRIRIDPHSPTRFRVIGPLSNSLEFAKAFGCRAGSPMVRNERCEIW